VVVPTSASAAAAADVSGSTPELLPGVVPTSAPAAAVLSEWQLFGQLLPPAILNSLDPKPPQAVYTPHVVTWLLVYQRLHDNATLNQAVAELLFRFPKESLPDCKRTHERTLSANTGAYSQARTDLDSRVCYFAIDHVFDSLVSTYSPSYKGRRAFLVDGSTLQLAPTAVLRAAYPPASNQHGVSAWPILHLAVAHELSSGLAVRPELGPMYGPEAVGEIALAKGLLQRLPKNSILLADRNFGIFAFAHAGVEAGHDVLVRLTQKRFNAMLKKARQVGPGKWALSWRPSASDRRAHPELAAEAVVAGHLYAVQVSDRLTLWLFATLDGTAAEMAELYGLRLRVETDIRDLKETLCLSEMTSKSPAMVEKELMMAMVAYNLVNQIRRLAAAKAEVQPRRLSFAGVASLVQAFEARVLDGLSAEQLQAEFDLLLRAAGQRMLPNRPKARAYKREVLKRRRNFPERKCLKKLAPPGETK
jgi:hypothetical protein